MNKLVYLTIQLYTPARNNNTSKMTDFLLN